jgi:hypothetical protein
LLEHDTIQTGSEFLSQTIALSIGLFFKAFVDGTGCVTPIEY